MSVQLHPAIFGITHPLILILAHVERFLAWPSGAFDLKEVPRPRALPCVPIEIPIAGEDPGEVTRGIVVNKVRRLSPVPWIHIRVIRVNRDVLSYCTLPIIKAPASEGQRGKQFEDLHGGC